VPAMVAAEVGAAVKAVTGAGVPAVAAAAGRLRAERTGWRVRRGAGHCAGAGASACMQPCHRPAVCAPDTRTTLRALASSPPNWLAEFSRTKRSCPLRGMPSELLLPAGCCCSCCFCCGSGGGCPAWAFAGSMMIRPSASRLVRAPRNDAKQCSAAVPSRGSTPLPPLPLPPPPPPSAAAAARLLPACSCTAPALAAAEAAYPEICRQAQQQGCCTSACWAESCWCAVQHWLLAPALHACMHAWCRAQCEF